MDYRRFGLMILTSTVVMFILMYINTYAWEHVFFSETRAYMAGLMGAAMAIIMLAYMRKMYENERLNLVIFGGAAIVFALCLWLVRSQATVSGSSYMRAMIPHHSIAIMTSERAQIRDPRVRKLADEIIEAQRREIAEMRYLVAQLSEGNMADSVYRDPPAEPGTVRDALSRVLVSELDLAPMPEAEAERVLEASARCTFRRSTESDPVLWVAESGAAAAKLNGVLVRLSTSDRRDRTRTLTTPGGTITVRWFGAGEQEGELTAEADLVLALEQGLTVGYRGVYACAE